MYILTNHEFVTITIFDFLTLHFTRNTNQLQEVVLTWEIASLQSVTPSLNNLIPQWSMNSHNNAPNNLRNVQLSLLTSL